MASFISIIKVFNGSAITQNTAITEVVDLSKYNVEGFFSIQLALVGAGNIDLIWSVSNDGENFVTPSGTDDLESAFDATSGPGSDGKDIVSFDPPLCKYIKFTATEQNAGAITSLTCHLAIQ